MENYIPWQCIVKNIKGNAEPHDVELLNKWLEADKSHYDILFEIENIYKLTSSIPVYFYPDKERAWKRIDRKTQYSLAKVKQLFKKLKYTAAALVLLFFSLTLFWTYHNRTLKERGYFSEIVVPPGQKTMVILPDSSLVWLNSGSSLKYNGDFNIKYRELVLEGEAFFDIKRNETKKFIVRTGILSVQVYGTSFNIKNYEDDNFQEITVSEGRIGIYNKTKELKQLIPGQQGILNKSTNQLTILKTEPQIVSSWKDNELRFDNTPLDEVVKYLERWYGVNINIDATMVGKHNYTFKIKTESLTEILEKIKVMTPIAYEINGKDVKIRYTL